MGIKTKFDMETKEQKSNSDQPDVSGSLPTDNDIEKEANSYDNAMSSMAESVWMPEGFKEGAKWMRKKLIGQ